MEDRERAIRLQCRDDFVFYAERNLKIRTKEGSVLPFLLNRAQLHIHQCFERQRKEAGKVRAIILKGRQQGCSTYVGGRFYWRATHRRGVQVYILTHEQPATENLFSMVKRYHENCNPLLKPQTLASNAKELIFNTPERDGLDSGYKLGTAGNRGTGRSSTIQYFHGSEVAFWPHAADHATGVLQAVPDVEDTEVVLESTANGIGNYYHSTWQAAEAGLSDYQAIFVPWFWQPEYRKIPEDGFSPTQEEQEYQRLYDLNIDQLRWVRQKVAEFEGDWTRFHQEYPATPQLAFETSNDAIMVPSHLVAKARKTDVAGYGPFVAGLDVARFGDDRTALAIRQGRKIHEVRRWHGKDTMEVVGIAVRAIGQYNLLALFVDVIGIGAGVVDRLNELGYGHIVKPVNSAERSHFPERYLNKRAEMWGEFKRFLQADMPVDLPDSDELHADLVGPTYSYDSSGRLVIEKKEKMKERGLRSPDLAEAVLLTFAEPVNDAMPQSHFTGVKMNPNYVPLLG